MDGITEYIGSSGQKPMSATTKPAERDPNRRALDQGTRGELDRTRDHDQEIGDSFNVGPVLLQYYSCSP